MAIFGSQDDETSDGDHQEGGQPSSGDATSEKPGAASGEQGHDTKDDDHDHDGATSEHAGDSHDGHHAADMNSMAGRKAYFLDPDHLLGHVQDTDYFEYPWFFHDPDSPSKVYLPNPLGYTDANPMIKAPAGAEKFINNTTFAPTKFVVLELVAAVLIAAVFIPYAKRVRTGGRPEGRFWNLIDVVVCYVKDQIAVPAIGKSDSKRFLPLLWTVFFFVLTLNLFGMVPGLGAATGSLTVTAALALVVFGVVIGTGSKKMGVLGFWKAQVPHMDLPAALGVILVPMIWAIEVFGLFVKHVVLAVRLFANMFAGHLVLAVFVAFVGVIGTYWAGIAVGPAVLAISLLELMVAFIQAYVFTFLTALFIGAAVHPH